MNLLCRGCTARSAVLVARLGTHPPSRVVQRRAVCLSDSPGVWVLPSIKTSFRQLANVRQMRLCKRPEPTRPRLETPSPSRRFVDEQLAADLGSRWDLGHVEHKSVAIIAL